MALPPPTKTGYQLWWYYPSTPGNIIFAVLFCILSIAHLIGLALNRLMLCLPLLIGGILEIIGYGLRTYAHSQTDNVPIYAGQNLMILLAPILFAASIYMYLGRLMLATNTTSLSPVPTKWLTKLFVAGDVLCFFIQAVGGSMLSVKKLADKQYIGENIVLGGLCLQILVFGMFVVVAVVVHVRMNRQRIEEKVVAWRRLLVVLYVVSSLICLRNIFRAVEYALGSDGYLLTHEWPGFVFDGALMVLVLVICLSWYVGRGSKLSGRHNSSASTEELKHVRV